MKKLKYVFLLGAVLMGIAIVYGLGIGDFMGEGSVLLGLYWGQVTMLDIYLAFFTFIVWMLYREGVNIKSIILTVAVLGLGAFTICLYMFVAMNGAKGDWEKLWLGEKRRK